MARVVGMKPLGELLKRGLELRNMTKEQLAQYTNIPIEKIKEHLSSYYSLLKITDDFIAVLRCLNLTPYAFFCL